MKSRYILALILCTSSFFITSCTATSTKESTGEYLDSTVVTTKVKTALFEAKDLDSSNIAVSSYKNIVQLSGFVNSPSDVNRAGEIASQVSGVRKVENDLIVK
jgi:osmotically-inducible protein OsmY